MEKGTAYEASSAAWLGPSALRGPLLGLLFEQDRPISCYRLSSLLMRRLPAWQVTHSSVANLLKRLLEEGYACASPEGSRVYCATDKARLALEDWMQKPLCRQAIREELHARIASASPHHAPLLCKALDDYERECIEMLGAHSGAITPIAPLRSWRSLTITLTRAAADESLRANITWSRLARQMIGDWITTCPAEAFHTHWMSVQSQ